MSHIPSPYPSEHIIPDQILTISFQVILVRCYLNSVNSLHTIGTRKPIEISLSPQEIPRGLGCKAQSLFLSAYGHG